MTPRDAVSKTKTVGINQFSSANKLQRNRRGGKLASSRWLCIKTHQSAVICGTSLDSGSNKVLKI